LNSSTLTAQKTIPNQLLFARALDGAIDTLMSLSGTATTELLLVRNAEPDNPTSANEGMTEPPLSERGRRQSARLATRLRELDIDAVYSSTTRSAMETAAVVAAARDLQVVLVPDLRDLELNPAALNGNTPDRQKLEAELCIRFANNPRWDALRGVEPTRLFRHRTIQAIEAIASRGQGTRLAIVTHQANINAYLSMVLGIERDMFFSPEFTSISTVRILRDRYGVHGLNDHAHLFSDEVTD
jgi:probable phosphoglycerate mutase